MINPLIPLNKVTLAVSSLVMITLFELNLWATNGSRYSPGVDYKWGRNLAQGQQMGSRFSLGSTNGVEI